MKAVLKNSTVNVKGIGDSIETAIKEIYKQLTTEQRKKSHRIAVYGSDKHNDKPLCIVRCRYDQNTYKVRFQAFEYIYHKGV